MTAALREQRLGQVVRMVAHGCHRDDVLGYAASAWNLSPRAADRLLAAARERIAAELAADLPMLIMEALADLQASADEARACGDYESAAEFMKRRTRLLGLRE